MLHFEDVTDNVLCVEQARVYPKGQWVLYSEQPRPQPWYEELPNNIDDTKHYKIHAQLPATITTFVDWKREGF